MLPDKLASMSAARDESASASVSMPRKIARVRGKALHHGCTIGAELRLRHTIRHGGGGLAVATHA